MAMQGGDAFDWDGGNLQHAQRHGFTADQIEQALDDPFGVATEATDLDGEERFGWVGMANTGQLIAVVYTVRGDAIRPISARKATRWERQLYTERR